MCVVSTRGGVIEGAGELQEATNLGKELVTKEKSGILPIDRKDVIEQEEKANLCLKIYSGLGWCGSVGWSTLL